MSRCLASCFIAPGELKRCIRPPHGPRRSGWRGFDEGHLWVEATNTDGEAMVVRWYGDDKQPAEVLIAKKVAPQNMPTP